MNMGFHCPQRQTTADFLTSLTSPSEREVKPGFENRVPRTPDEFADVWKKSAECKRLLQDIDSYKQQYPVAGEQLEKFKQSRAAQQAKRMRIESPYTISVPMQIKLCIKRGFQRLGGDLTNFCNTVFGNMIIGLIVGSVFYDLKDNTSSFFLRGALLFFAVLMNAFASILEVCTPVDICMVVVDCGNSNFDHRFSLSTLNVPSSKNTRNMLFIIRSPKPLHP